MQVASIGGVKVTKYSRCVLVPKERPFFVDKYALAPSNYSCREVRGCESATADERPIRCPVLEMT